MDKKENAIAVDHLTKTFRVPTDKAHSLKDRILGRASRGYKEFTPLDNISFEINKGDFFSIAGRNGSGKSTLLRTISGIYTPTSGTVHIDGSLVPFIELGVGFNPQLTGKENIYLNAALLGFSREQVNEIYADIVKFAELEDFMEERLQNYSSGMQVRLAFSIAIRAKTDILLLDEVLAVGDTAFQEKCFEYFRRIKSEERTVVLVTHNMNHIREFCNRGLVLEDGKIKIIGSSSEVADAYSKLFTTGERLPGIKSRRARGSEIMRLGLVKIKHETVKEKEGHLNIITEFVQKDDSYVDFNISIEVRNQHDLLMFSTSSTYLTDKYLKFRLDEIAKITFKIKDLSLGNGSYYVNLKARATKSGTSIRNDVLNEKHVATFAVNGHVHNQHNLIHPTIELGVAGAGEYGAGGPKVSERIEIVS